MQRRVDLLHMSTLNYRNKDDGRPEERARFRMGLFGPSKADVWKALAGEVGGTFTRGGFLNCKERVDVKVGRWEITLDCYSVHTGKTTMVFTRMRAPYVNADGLRFKISRKSIFTPIGKLLGMQDIEVGFPEFDEAFVIKGNNESQLRRLFANERLRQLLGAQKNVHFEVCDDEGWFGAHFPESADELRFHTPGIIKDIDQLRNLYEVFAETLHTLCHIGSAYEDDPGVKV